MTAPRTLLDTDILSAVMRRQSLAMQRARQYVSAHGQFSFSILSRFEIPRGLHARGASAQMASFDQLCQASDVLALADAIVVRGAEIYGDLHQRGLLIGDADILIAATALTGGYVLATNNEQHFSRSPGLVIDNWLRP